MMKYWECIYRKKGNDMNEWDGEKRNRYEGEWGHQMEMGRYLVIECQDEGMQKNTGPPNERRKAE